MKPGLLISGSDSQPWATLDDYTSPPLWFDVSTVFFGVTILAVHGALLGGLWKRRRELRSASDAALCALWGAEWVHNLGIMILFFVNGFSTQVADFNEQTGLPVTTPACQVFASALVPLVGSLWFLNCLIAYIVKRNGVDVHKKPITRAWAFKASAACLAAPAVLAALPALLGDTEPQRSMTVCIFGEKTWAGDALNVIFSISAVVTFIYTVYAFSSVLRLLFARHAGDRAVADPDARGESRSTTGATSQTTSDAEQPRSGQAVAKRRGERKRARRALAVVSILVGSFVFSQVVGVVVFRILATGTLLAPGGTAGYLSDIIVGVNMLVDGVAYLVMSARYRDAALDFLHLSWVQSGGSTTSTASTQRTAPAGEAGSVRAKSSVALSLAGVDSSSRQSAAAVVADDD